MRKYIILVLIVTLLVSLTLGCGKKTTGQAAPDVKPKEQQVARITAQVNVPPLQENRALENGSVSQAQAQKPVSSYRERFEKDQQMQREVHAEYEAAKDKRAFLLEHATMPYPGVQIFVAIKLSEYEGPEVVAALQKIKSEGAMAFEDMPDSPAHAAAQALDKVESAADLRRLSPTIPLAEQLEIITKYAGSSNSHARGSIYDYLIKEVDTHPEEFVPTLLTYYTYRMDVNSKSQMISVAQKYPSLATRGLDGCLSSPNVGTMEGCIDLIGDMKLEAYLPRLIGLIYPDRRADKNSIVSVTKGSIAKYSNKALPNIKAMLYNGNPDSQSDAIGIHARIGTADALTALKKFRTDYVKNQNKNVNVLDHLNTTITMMEEGKK